MKYPTYNDIMNGRGANQGTRRIVPEVPEVESEDEEDMPEEIEQLQPHEAMHHARVILNLNNRPSTLPQYNNSMAEFHIRRNRAPYNTLPENADIDDHLRRAIHENVPVPLRHRTFLSHVLNDSLRE